MKEAHKLSGETVYELSDEEKEEYDKAFPNVKGQYPKIVITVVPLDTNEYSVTPNFLGIVAKYNISFDNSPQWRVMNRTYTISSNICKKDETVMFFCM